MSRNNIHGEGCICKPCGYSKQDDEINKLPKFCYECGDRGTVLTYEPLHPIIDKYYCDSCLPKDRLRNK